MHLEPIYISPANTRPDPISYPDTLLNLYKHCIDDMDTIEMISSNFKIVYRYVRSMSSPCKC
jgi:hypothetical protein